MATGRGKAGLIGPVVWVAVGGGLALLFFRGGAGLGPNNSPDGGPVPAPTREAISPKSTEPPPAPIKPSAEFTITIEDEQYLTDGKTRTLNEIILEAQQLKEHDVNLKARLKVKGNARILTVRNLEAELDRLGVRYLEDNDF